MKDFNFTELFCEIFSGIVAILLFLLIKDVFTVFELKDFFFKITTNINVLTILIIGGYFIGLLIDTIGLAIGEWFLDDLLATLEVPNSRENRDYITKAPEYTYKYRDIQWTYYSLYRNLLIMFVLGIPFLSIKLFQVCSAGLAFVLTLISILIVISIIKSCRTLIDLYYSITK